MSAITFRILPSRRCRLAGWVVLAAFATLLQIQAAIAQQTNAAKSKNIWARHTIDNSSRGADGARLLDANGDGRLDIATGWEEGHRIRVYLHPGPEQVREPWPAVTVGEVRSPEDAVLVDLDGDGATDVVSSCEGRARTMYVHWAPAQAQDYLKPEAWQTEAIPASEMASAWMFCLPLDVDGQRGIDLIAGSKSPNAVIGWYESPQNPRSLADWKWHPIYEAGWIMSMEAVDMDGDGDLDVLASDRKGSHNGCVWLENPGTDVTAKKPDTKWAEHRIGTQGKQVMFLDYADLDQDGLVDVIVPTSGAGIWWHRRLSKDGTKWETIEIDMPPSGVGTGKSARALDVNGDGQLDLVVSCENAKGELQGLFWLSADDGLTNPKWTFHEISGPVGLKFDLLQLCDLDEDGDLDVITCEERDQLGVVWYENPGKK